MNNTSPSPKRRGRLPKSQSQILLAKESIRDSTPCTPGGSTLTPATAGSTKRRGRQFKSKEFIEDTDDEDQVRPDQVEPTSLTPNVIPDSTPNPERKKRKARRPSSSSSSSLSPVRSDSPRTRSQSRTRNMGKRKLVEGAVVGSPLRPHVGKRRGVGVRGDGDMDEVEEKGEEEKEKEKEKPRKKRKTAS